MAIELKKGSKVNLTKAANKDLGEILVNLNWDQTPHKPKGIFGKLMGNQGVDLDLGCLYELKNGEKGCVQALGNAFGSLNNIPYIQLDGDDRTGSNTLGENLRINGNKLSDIKRILIYTFIYQGIANWSETNGVVTLKQQDGPDLVVKLDEYKNGHNMCAIAMVTNEEDRTFGIEKVVRYFKGHQDMDKAFSWNMRWTKGRK